MNQILSCIALFTFLAFSLSSPVPASQCSPQYKLFAKCFEKLKTCISAGRADCAFNMKFCAVAPLNCTQCELAGKQDVTIEYLKELIKGGHITIVREIKKFSTCRQTNGSIDSECIDARKERVEKYLATATKDESLKTFERCFTAFTNCRGNGVSDEICSTQMIDCSITNTLMKIMKQRLLPNLPLPVMKQIRNYLACKYQPESNVKKCIFNSIKEIDAVMPTREA